MSLVDPTHVETTRMRRDCHYEMKPGANGQLAMSMKIWMRDIGDTRCPNCFFNPMFYKDNKCPKCGSELEKG